MTTAELVTLTDENFEREIESGEGLAIVDFWAEWCGPCRLVSPFIEELAREYAGQLKVGKLDVDSNRAVSQKYNIRSIPSILYFQDGKLVDTVIGAVPKAHLENKIHQYI